MPKVSESLPARECTACGKSFQPKRKDQKTCGSPQCHNKSRGARGRSEASKASSKARDVQKTKDSVANKVYIAFDGEGCNPEDIDPETGILTKQDHRYTYMAACDTDGNVSELNMREGEDFIRTEDALRWMHKLAKGKSAWFYSGKYDWTHIFRSLIYNEEDLKIMWQTHHPEKNPDGSERDVFTPVRWGHWGITYVQGSVKITRYYRERGALDLKEGEEQCETGHTKDGLTTMCVLAKGHGRKDKETGAPGRRHCFPGVEFGVDAFFQDAFKCFGGGKFTAMLKSWDVGSPEVIERIDAMKDKRAHFTWVDREVKDYCIEEVHLLAEAVQKIVLTFNEMDIRPKSGCWYSAGSAAKAMLRTRKIPAEYDRDGNLTWEGYRGVDRYAGAPLDIQDILDRSYFGGWFENAETGLFDELFSEDFKSAYPAIIRDLPCMAHGTWSHNYAPGGVNFGRVSWDIKAKVSPQDVRWTPAPWRWPNGMIYRPTIGEGWYCEAEIVAMQKLPDFDVTVHEWVGFERGCDDNPFHWVQEVYDLRVQLGNDGRGLVLKVSLNSIYGSFADTLQKDSKYANIAWAAMITGGCRAKILDEIAWRGDKIVSIATDGILSTELSPKAERTNILGELNYEGSVTDVLLIQPGLYLARDGKDPKKTARSRGHGIGDLKAIEEELREAWTAHGWGAEVTYSRTRLIPAKLALARNAIEDVYGQWVTEPVTLKFMPPRRQPINDPGQHKRTAPTVSHLYATDRDGLPLDTLSYAFDRKRSAEINQQLKDEKELEDAQP